MKLGLVIYLSLLSCLVTQGCSRELPSDGRIRIVCSILPHYCFTSEIVGDLAVVELLASPTIGPHAYQPTLKDRRRLSSSDVFIFNGLGLESSFSKDFVQSLERQGVVVVRAGESLSTSDRILLGSDAQIQTHDPHTWLCERGAIEAAQAIFRGVVDSDPENESEYQQGLTRLESKIRGAFKKWRKKLSVLEYRTILPYHDAWAYFAREFNLQVPTTVTLSGSPTSISKRLELEKIIRSGAVPAIFVEPQFRPLEVEFLVQETGVAIATLDPGVTTTTSPDENTYFEIMNTNIEELLRVLSPVKKE